VIGEMLFRWRLAVIVGAFGLAGAYALIATEGPRSLAELVGLERAFLITGPLCLLAFLLRVTGEARLGAVVYGQRASPRVVTGGLFRFSRHPLYIGTWLFFVAATAPYLPPAVLALLALGFALALVAIGAHEERALAAAHGDAWTRYARAVPRVLGMRGLAKGAVDDDGIRPTARAWFGAGLGNLFFLSLGLYRIIAALCEPSKAFGLANVVCLLVWLVVVAARRLRH
jgi:protein-S-isoprenylcysteine O-methyltransferase Ste14